MLVSSPQAIDNLFKSNSKLSAKIAYIQIRNKAEYNCLMVTKNTELGDRN